MRYEGRRGRVVAGWKTAEMGDEERKSAGTVIYWDGQGERARKRRAAFFRRKQGRRGAAERKTADTGTGAAAGQCAYFRPEQQKSPAPKWGLFLTEYAELGKMQSGAARTAGGWLHHPKGGAAYANHITYWSLYGDNHCEKQKPPLWQVTVSGHSFELVTY